MGKVFMKPQGDEAAFKSTLGYRKGEEIDDEEIKDPEDEGRVTDPDDGTGEGEGGAKEDEGNGGEGKGEGKQIDYEALFKEERRKREELINKVLDGKGEGGQKPTEPEPIKPPAAVTLIKEEEITEDKFLSAIQTKEGFVKVLNEVANKAYQKAYEEVLKVVPEVANNVAGFRVTLSELNRQFFEAHPELAKMRKFVSTVADEIITKEGINDLPGYERMLNDLPQRVQEKLDELGISAAAVTTKDGGEPSGGKGGKKPSTPQAPGGQRRRPAKEDLDNLSSDLKRSLEFAKKRRGLVK